MPFTVRNVPMLTGMKALQDTRPHRPRRAREPQSSWIHSQVRAVAALVKCCLPVCVQGPLATVHPGPRPPQRHLQHPRQVETRGQERRGTLVACQRLYRSRPRHQCSRQSGTSSQPYVEPAAHAPPRLIFLSADVTLLQASARVCHASEVVPV